MSRASSESLFGRSSCARVDVLRDRVLVAFVLPHNHPGIAGLDEGEGCPRCNAEVALDELVKRADDRIDFTPPRRLWVVGRSGRLVRPRKRTWRTPEDARLIEALEAALERSERERDKLREALAAKAAAARPLRAAPRTDDDFTPDGNEKRT